MRMKVQHVLSAAVLGLAALATSSQAAVTPIAGNAGDYGFRVVPSPTTFNTTGATLDVGPVGTGTGRNAGILVFALPTLQPGEFVGPDTSLSVTLTATTTFATSRADLWGVGNFPSALTPVDYYSDSDTGAGNPNPTLTDAKLVDNLAVANQAVGEIDTPTGAGNALQAYLQAFYTANPTYDASAGQRYAFLRLNLDTNVGNAINRRFAFASAEGAAGTTPVLNLDVAVPEPTSLALVGVGALVALRRRR